MNISIMVEPDPYVSNILDRSFCPPVIAGISSSQEFAQNKISKDSWSPLRLPDILQSTHDQVEIAVKRGQLGFESGSWARLSKHTRRVVLLKWAELLEQHGSQLALINCLETGRSVRSLVEHSLPKAVKVIRWFAELTDKLEDRSVHSGEYGNDFALIRREPLGLVAVILPWNDPLVTLAWKVSPALAMGNSVIVKPSEYATVVIDAALSLAHSAGIPIDHLQMLTGDGLVGETLVRQKPVSKIAFTGSTATASKIGSLAHSANLKRLSMECGGKGAFIFGKAGTDMQAFVRVVAENIFYNQGQICSAPSVIHLPKTARNLFISEILKVVRDYIPQHPLSGHYVGLMISKEATSRVRKGLQDLGPSFFAGGLPNYFELSFPERSLPPTIIIDLPDQHFFWDSELFAPVLLVRPYDDISEAVNWTNQSSFGLSCGIWSNDIDEIIEIASSLRVGNFHINSWGDDPNSVPFGGVKQSGYGREKSVETLNDYTYTKSIFYRPRSL